MKRKYLISIGILCLMFLGSLNGCSGKNYLLTVHPVLDKSDFIIQISKNVMREKPYNESGFFSTKTIIDLELELKNLNPGISCERQDNYLILQNKENSAEQFLLITRSEGGQTRLTNMAVNINNQNGERLQQQFYFPVPYLLWDNGLPPYELDINVDKPYQTNKTSADFMDFYQLTGKFQIEEKDNGFILAETLVYDEQGNAVSTPLYQFVFVNGDTLIIKKL